MAEIEAGRYDCVLVVGAEEFKNTRGDIASVNQNAAGWQGARDIDCKFLWPAVFGPGRAGIRPPLWAGPSLSEPHRRDQLWQRKAQPAGAKTRSWEFNALSFTDDDNANPIIEPGTRRQDCGQITDGASSLVLASAAFAADWSRRTRKRAAKIAG